MVRLSFRGSNNECESNILIGMHTVCGCNRKPLLRLLADIAEAALREELGGI